MSLCPWRRAERLLDFGFGFVAPEWRSRRLFESGKEKAESKTPSLEGCVFFLVAVVREGEGL